MNSNRVGVMNNTKWEEIRLAMYGLPFVIKWRTKDVNSGQVCDWDSDWFYHFKLLGNVVTEESYKHIEWLEIDLSTGSDEIVQTLKGIHVPGVVNQKTAIVFGYLNNGQIEYI